MTGEGGYGRGHAKAAHSAWDRSDRIGKMRGIISDVIKVITEYPVLQLPLRPDPGFRQRAAPALLQRSVQRETRRYKSQKSIFSGRDADPDFLPKNSFCLLVFRSNVGLGMDTSPTLACSVMGQTN